MRKLLAQVFVIAGNVFLTIAAFVDPLTVSKYYRDVHRAIDEELAAILKQEAA
jgi:hypothetical protein